jgi:hypothetical protein
MDNVSEAITKVLTLPAQIELSKANTTAQAANAQTMYGAIGEMLSGMMEDSNTLGNSTDTPMTVRSRALEQYNAELQNNNIAIKAGFNQDMAIDIRAIMLRDIHDIGLQMREVSNKLAADKAVSLFDDPLLAVMNAFTIPWTEQELEGLASTQANRKKTLDDSTSGVTASAQAQNAIKKTLTLDAINNQTKALEGMVANQKRKLSTDLLTNNVAGIKFAMDADHKQLTFAAELNKYLNDERNYSLHLKQANAVMEQRDWALEERVNEKKASEDRLKFVNLALDKNGVPTIASIYDLKAKMQTPEGKKLVDDLTDKGRLLADSKLSPLYTDGDPGNIKSYIQHWERTGKPANTPESQEFVKLMYKAYNNGQTQKGKREGVELTGEQYLAEKFAEKFNTVSKDDGANPNRAQTFTTMADRAARTTDPKFRQVFAIAVAPNISDSNKTVSAHPELVGPMVVDAVKAGKVSPNDAAMFLADFYTASTQIATEISKVREWTGKTFTGFSSEVTVSGTIGKQLTGAGIAAAGIGAAAMGVPVLGAPILAGGAVVTGTGMALTQFASRKESYNWTDPVSVQSYIIRKGFAGSTLVTPGDTTAPKAKPTGAPVQ